MGLHVMLALKVYTYITCNSFDSVSLLAVTRSYWVLVDKSEKGGFASYECLRFFESKTFF